MVTLPFQGHINPVLRFAKRLVSKGVHVTLATTEVARQTFSYGKSTSMIDSNQNRVDEGPKIDLMFFSDGLNLDFDRNKHLDLMLQSLPLAGSKNLSNLITDLASKGQTFSCIIYQLFVPWVADVDADHGIPCAMLCLPFIINSFNELEAADVVKSMGLFKPVLPIGPLMPSALIGKEEAITDRLDMWNSDDSCLQWTSIWIFGRERRRDWWCHV